MIVDGIDVSDKRFAVAVVVAVVVAVAVAVVVAVVVASGAHCDVQSDTEISF